MSEFAQLQGEQLGLDGWVLGAECWQLKTDG